MKERRRSVVDQGVSVTDHFAAWLAARGETVKDAGTHRAITWYPHPGTADILRQAYYGEHPGLL